MPGPTSPHGIFLGSRYFDGLDGLRAISILGVIWHHSARSASGVLSRGHLGVELFFAMSGFLITTLLLREARTTGGISLGAFYVRRALRIFPLYYAMIAVYTLLVVVTERRSDPGGQFLSNLPWFLTYTSNWFVDLGHGGRVIFYFAWSLATEEQFYLVWPWVVRFARRWYHPPVFMCGLVALDLLVEWARGAGLVSADALQVRILTSFATPIGLGSLAAIALHHERSFSWAARALGRPWSSSVAAAALVGSVVIDGVPRLLMELSMTALVVACCIRPAHALQPLLANRVVRYVGTISYGMYLLHMLAINAARRLVSAQEGLAVFVVATGLSIALAAASYRYFETPFLLLKEKLRTGRRVAPALDATVPLPA